jgi:serine/threonine protein kinase
MIDWEPNTEWIIRSHEIQLGSKIASGGYGTVYKGKCRGQVVAIKKLHDQVSGDKLEELKKEVQIMSQLRHPNILLLMGVCPEPENVALVMEFVEGKSLYTILHEDKVPLTTTQKFQLAKDIAKGCYWLHCLDPPIIHRDIKPANVLVDTHFRVQLCDFGLSCVKESSTERKATVVGSPYWMAPEVLTGRPNTEKSDVYAYAVLLWEVFTGNAPNKDVSDYRAYMYDVVNQGRRPQIPDDLFPPMKDFISLCWAQDAKKRPNFATILELLDEVYIQMVIHEQPAQDMWKEFRAESHYPYYVDWDLFISKFYSKLQLPSASLQSDIGVLCLRAFLAERHTDFTTSSTVKLVVNAHKFGDFLDRFGPVWSDGASAPLNIISEVSTSKLSPKFFRSMQFVLA